MGEGSSPRRWTRGPCKAEKPTQGAPARAQKPTSGAPARAHLPELVSKFAVLDHHLGSFMPTASAKRGQPRDVWRHTNRINAGRKSSREPRRAAARRPACCPRQAPRVSTRSPDGVPRFCVRSARAGAGAPAAPEFAALRASGLRAGEEGGGAGTAAPLPTRAPEGRGMQGDARAAAGRQGAAAGSRYARARPRRRRREILREIFSSRLHLPSILLFAETTISGSLRFLLCLISSGPPAKVLQVSWSIGPLPSPGLAISRGRLGDGGGTEEGGRRRGRGYGTWRASLGRQGQLARLVVGLSSALARTNSSRQRRATNHGAKDSTAAGAGRGPGAVTRRYCR